MTLIFCSSYLIVTPYKHALQHLEPKQNEKEANYSKKPRGVEGKRFVRFSLIKTQMTETLARTGMFMRVETLKVGKPYDCMQVCSQTAKVFG